jgi:membrane dipeptidase
MKLLISFVCCFCFVFLLAQQKQNSFHHKSILVDTHNDVISNAVVKGLNINTNLLGKTHTDIERYKQGGVDVQIFSIFCDERFGYGFAYDYANTQIDSLYAIVERNSNYMKICSTYTQVKAAIKNKKFAAMMGVEGGHMLEDKIENIDTLAKRGVKYITLTWNNSTRWASSAKDEFNQATALQQKGLSSLGKQMIERMNALGVMVDISHVGEKTFYDALQTTTKPVIASHSSVHALCPVFRNLKDSQIIEIAKNKGLINVNFYAGFLDSNYNKSKAKLLANHQPEVDSLTKLKIPYYTINEMMVEKYPEEANAIRPPLSLLIQHIDYIVQLVGIDYVGIGSDFDGIEAPPKELNGVQDYPILTKALLNKGYSKKDVQKILGLNFLRVLKANEVTTTN